MKDSKENFNLPELWKIEKYHGCQEEFVGPHGMVLKINKDEMEINTSIKVYDDQWTSYQDVYEYIPLDVLAAFLERNGYDVKKLDKDKT
jgi:hypothetical protein